MNQNEIHPMQKATELRLLAATIELQHLTGMASNMVPIPGGDREIAVGAPADVLRLLEVTSAAQPVAASAGIEGLTRYFVEFESREPEAAYLAADVERLLATQSAKQGAQPSEPYAYEEDNGADTELVYAAWFKNGLGKMDPDSIYRPLYLGQPPTAPLQTMDDTTQAAREQSEPAGYISSAAAALIKAKKSGPVSVGVSVSPIHADADVAIYFAVPASTAPKQALSTMADSLPANLATQVPPNVRDQAPGDSK